MNSLIIPVYNEEKNLPALFRSLRALKVSKTKSEIIFVDNHSTDDSPALLKQFSRENSHVRVLQEPKHGFAPPLNKALLEAKGDILLFLDADALPQKNWLQEMEKALIEADLVVGAVDSPSTKVKTKYEELARALFKDHSQRTAHAITHALPWGPTCNLGVKKSVVEQVGNFSEAAEGAMDVDFCWRAILQGAKVSYAAEAKVFHKRRGDAISLFEQFDRYGVSEAWIHHTYSFLQEDNIAISPLQASIHAYHRLSQNHRIPKKLSKELGELAAVFASGVRAGYERPYQACSLPRKLPSQAVGWHSAKNEMSFFVPGKGIATFQGKMAKFAAAWQAGEKDLELLFIRLFKASPQEAHHEVMEFIEAMQP